MHTYQNTVLSSNNNKKVSVRVNDTSLAWNKIKSFGFIAHTGKRNSGINDWLVSV